MISTIKTAAQDRFGQSSASIRLGMSLPLGVYDMHGDFFYRTRMRIKVAKNEVIKDKPKGSFD